QVSGGQGAAHGVELNAGAETIHEPRPAEGFRIMKDDGDASVGGFQDLQDAAKLVRKTARGPGEGGASSCSSNFRSSSRRRLAHGASPKRSNSMRPFLVNSAFLRQSPWLMASACNWLPSMVRRQTSLWRCQSNCRRSRSAGVGTQILGKRLASRRKNQ